MSVNKNHDFQRIVRYLSFSVCVRMCVRVYVCMYVRVCVCNVSMYYVRVCICI